MLFWYILPQVEELFCHLVLVNKLGPWDLYL